MMLKLFFKSILYGLRGFYEEFRPIILFFASTMIPIAVVWWIGKLFTEDSNVLVLAAIIAAVVGFVLLVNYSRCKEAMAYQKEYQVSFEEAWIMTKASDDW